MSFKFVPHIAVQVSDAGKAVDFYRRVLGMELVSASPSDAEPRLHSNGMTFHIEESPRGSVFFGFEVENLDEAKQALQRDGCEIRADPGCSELSAPVVGVAPQASI